MKIVTTAATDQKLDPKIVADLKSFATLLNTAVQNYEQGHDPKGHELGRAVLKMQVAITRYNERDQKYQSHPRD